MTSANLTRRDHEREALAQQRISKLTRDERSELEKQSGLKGKLAYDKNLATLLPFVKKKGIFTVRLSPLGEVVFVKRNQPRKVPGDVVFRVDDNGYVEVGNTDSLVGVQLKVVECLRMDLHKLVTIGHEVKLKPEAAAASDQLRELEKRFGGLMDVVPPKPRERPCTAEVDLEALVREVEHESSLVPTLDELLLQQKSRAEKRRKQRERRKAGKASTAPGCTDDDDDGDDDEHRDSPPAATAAPEDRGWSDMARPHAPSSSDERRDPPRTRSSEPGGRIGSLPVGKGSAGPLRVCDSQPRSTGSTGAGTASGRWMPPPRPSEPCQQPDSGDDDDGPPPLIPAPD